MSSRRHTEEITGKPDRATIPNPSKYYPIGVRETTRIAEKSVVKEKITYLPLDPGMRADLTYTGEERFDTDENNCGTGYCRKKRGNRNSRGGKSKQKKYVNSSDSDGSSSGDEYGSKPDWKKCQVHRRRTGDRPRVSQRERDTDLAGLPGNVACSRDERLRAAVFPRAPTLFFVLFMFIRGTTYSASCSSLHVICASTCFCAHCAPLYTTPLSPFTTNSSLSTHYICGKGGPFPCKLVRASHQVRVLSSYCL